MILKITYTHEFLIITVRLIIPKIKTIFLYQHGLSTAHGMIPSSHYYPNNFPKRIK